MGLHPSEYGLKTRIMPTSRTSTWLINRIIPMLTGSDQSGCRNKRI